VSGNMFTVGRESPIEIVAERSSQKRHLERILTGSGKSQMPRDVLPQCGEMSGDGQQYGSEAT
jgi:hypothetical protein